jgi:hypothetical protein
VISKILHLTGIIAIVVQCGVGVITYIVPLILMKDEFLCYAKDRGINIVKSRFSPKKA